MRSARRQLFFAAYLAAIASGVWSFLACPHTARNHACADDARTRVYGAAGAKMHQLESRAMDALNQGRFAAASDLQSELLVLTMMQLDEDDWRLRVTRSRAATFATLANLSVHGQDEIRRALNLFKSGKRHLILDRFDQASTSFEQAATIHREYIGTENLIHCETLTNLAQSLSKSGNYIRASQVLQQNAEAKRAFLGDDHPSYALTIAELGNIECELGDFESAERHLLRALEIREQQFGSEFRDTVFALQELAAMYLKKSDPQSAEKYASRAIEIATRTMSQGNSNRILCQWRLAQCRAAQDDLVRAEQTYQEIVPEFERLTCHVDAPVAAEIINDYATVLGRLSKDDESTGMRDWAKKIRAEGVGVEMPRPVTTPP